MIRLYSNDRVVGVVRVVQRAAAMSWRSRSAVTLNAVTRCAVTARLSFVPAKPSAFGGKRQRVDRREEWPADA